MVRILFTRAEVIGENSEPHAGTAVTAFNPAGSTVYALLDADNKFYEAQVDLSVGANYDNKTNYSTNAVVKGSATLITELSKIWPIIRQPAVRLRSLRRQQAPVIFVLDTNGLNGKIYEGQAALGNINAYDSTPSSLYAPNDVVKDSIASPTAFYEATANWNSGGTAVVDHTSGNAPTTIANARIVEIRVTTPFTNRREISLRYRLTSTTAPSRQVPLSPIPSSLDPVTTLPAMISKPPSPTPTTTIRRK